MEFIQADLDECSNEDLIACLNKDLIICLNEDLTGYATANTIFPALEKFENITRDCYCGPTQESNFVIPGIMLAGAFPADNRSDAMTDSTIISILNKGVTMFVCLQKEYDDTLPEEAWRYGRAMRPYWNDVQRIISNTQNYPSLTVAIDASKLQFVHCPIVDMNITDDSVILNLAHKLVKAMSEGHVLYIHCWGGHGRTGTLVCIMLHLMYGIDAQTSIAYCQHVHDMRHATAFAKSPQTQSQCKQVIDVIKSCNLPS